MRSIGLCLLLPLVLLLSVAAQGEAIESQYGGLQLNANLVIPTIPPTTAPEEAREEIFLIIHGTWAHNQMEIIAALQALLEERGITSLAPTLSLGVDDRKGFLPCESPIMANYGAASEEIDHWVGFLEAQGWRSVTIVGHSRGAAQVALYQNRLARQSATRKSVKRLALLAPMVWRPGEVSSAYERRWQVPLATVLATASRADETELIGPYPLLNCEAVTASASTFLSYYDQALPKDTPTILQDVTVPVTVYLGTEDAAAAWSADDKRHAVINNQVRIVEIDGAGHFFRDLYLDDVVDDLIESSIDENAL